MDDVIERAHQAARERWAGIDVSAAEFGHYVAERLVAGADPSTLHTTDLYLAAACARGDSAALGVFEREYLASLGSMLARLDPPAVLVDDIRQLLRDRLFVHTPERPAVIVTYSGRGSLAGWLKVVAVREAIAALRKLARDGDDAFEILVAPSHDPELDLMRTRYQAEFREAFATALAELSDRDREVLRCHLVDGMSIDRIGSVYDVHRATAARWLASIRERLLTGTRQALMRKLAIEPAELESILRLIGSRLTATIP